MKMINSPSALGQFHTILATANLMAIIWLVLRFLTPFGWAFSTETFSGFLTIGLLLITGTFGAFYFLLTSSPPIEQERNIIVADHWNDAERRVISYLLFNSGECFQSDLLENCMFPNSVKVTRTVTKLLEKGAVQKFRDGMGNRLVLNHHVSLTKNRRFKFGK